MLYVCVCMFSEIAKGVRCIYKLLLKILGSNVTDREKHKC